ncbi:putative P450 monooxygenase [Ophiocordyceps camponoti-floridani]|uniref:Putative P450 monooxygenase n=1 Tax=Ophiocordyceps camponoti-floridani TaxID=2030778 RepID=A0A8H4Q536_9HYPO|nr:putative P450 monooxygenase [Ophiocordyceps camponoti-floridani]
MNKTTFKTVNLTLPKTRGLTATLSLVLLLSLTYLLLSRRNNKTSSSSSRQPEQVTQTAPWIPQRRLLRGLDLAVECGMAVRDDYLIPFLHGRIVLPGKSTVQLYLGGLHMYFTWEPANIKALLSDHKTWHIPRDRKLAMGPLLGRGIFTTDGADIPNPHDRTPRLSSARQDPPPDGTTVDLSDVFFRLSLDIGTDILFGESVGALMQEGRDGFGHLWESSIKTCAVRWPFTPLLAWFPWVNGRTGDMKRVFALVDGYVEKALERRRQQQQQQQQQQQASEPIHSTETRHIVLEEIASRIDNPTRIRSELLNFLLAGRDTTASLLTNIFFTLSKRPDIWQRLQTEISSLNGQPPSYTQLKKLACLDALLRESLRLYPVVPFIGRQAAVDTTLPTGGGTDGTAPVLIKRGQTVQYLTTMLHLRKDLYGQDAQEFRPERWLDDESAKHKTSPRATWRYLPFGGGARVCMGQQLALMQAAYATVRLCQRFDRLESRDEWGWRGRATMTMTSANGARVGLFARGGR